MEFKGQIIWVVIPFLAMVSLEGCTIALTIMAKTAITYGMSTFVFVVYTNAVASTILLPYSFIFHFNDRFLQLSHFPVPYSNFKSIKQLLKFRTFSFVFFSICRTEYQQSLFSFPLLLRIFLLGLTGFVFSPLSLSFLSRTNKQKKKCNREFHIRWMYER